jgi:hypothetical protein
MRRFTIVTVAAAAAALPLLGETVQSYAAEGPWCHTFGGATANIQNCTVQSLEMCRFEIQGNGGSCSPNPRWHGDVPDRRAGHPWPWR